MSHSMTDNQPAKHQPAQANRINSVIAVVALVAIGLHLLLRLGLTAQAAMGPVAIARHSLDSLPGIRGIGPGR